MTKSTHVVPPTMMDNKIAIGASALGFGISSDICITTSYPISDRADCSSPKTHETPSDQPVSFAKSVKTNLASVLSDVASSVMLMMITAASEWYTSKVSKTYERWRTLHTSSIVILAKISVAEKIDQSSVGQYSDEYEIGVPWSDIVAAS
jgi:hypothetical protein